MKYKKASIFMISILCLLSACNANEVSQEEEKTGDAVEEVIPVNENQHKLKDGQYFAEVDTHTSNWREIVDVEVVHGKIKKITFNAVNQEATDYKRSQNEQKESESDNKTDNGWEEQLQLLEDYLLKNQDSILTLTKETIQPIEGLTIDPHPFIELLQRALKTDPIQTGAYQDGRYFTTINDEQNKTKHTINLLVHHGYIIAAHWDTTIPSDLNLTEEEQSYVDQWNEQANLLEQHLIQLQDPTQITFNEENKTADISGVTIEVHQFIELATKALAGGPLLD